MNLQDLADQYNQRVKEDVQGLPITLVVTKLMALTAEFMTKAYELGLKSRQEEDAGQWRCDCQGLLPAPDGEAICKHWRPK